MLRRECQARALSGRTEIEDANLDFWLESVNRLLHIRIEPFRQPGQDYLVSVPFHRVDGFAGTVAKDHEAV